MGGVPAVVAPYVVNAIGLRQAKALFLTGRHFDAAQALTIGLVQEVVEGAEGLAAAIERLAGEALANGPEAMREAKQLVWDVWGQPFDHALMEETAKRFARARFGKEGREGLAAALAGRKPGWAGG